MTPQVDRQFDPDKACINYRFVVNDALCHPWEPMPEAGKSIAELVEFLKTCSHTRDNLGERWDYRRLSYGGTWDSRIVSYGARSQFWIPVVPQEADFNWTLESDGLTVVCCGEVIAPREDWDYRGSGRRW